MRLFSADKVPASRMPVAGRDYVGVVGRDLMDIDTDITARVGELVRRSAVVIYDDRSAHGAAVSQC